MKFTLHKTPLSTTNHYGCIISGDGLFNPLAKFLANKLAQKGMAIARVRAINYFWSKKSPRKMSEDLQRYMTRRLKRNKDASFVFIGYSFGAGTLPFAINSLPEHLKTHITNIVLIAPPAKADFEFFFRSWFHKTTRMARETAPEIQSLSQTIPTLYLHGEADYVGPRETLRLHANLKIISLPGGHDFNKNFEPVIRAIEDELGFIQLSQQPI